MESIVNASGKAVRVTRNGRDYFVAPLVLLVPGVLNGSRGPLYYPPEEVARSPGDWNDMPIVVYHPRRDGTYVSGRDPSILDYSKVGRVYNARVEKEDPRGRLRGEGWFDCERTRAVDPRVYDALEAGTPIELSTGLFASHEEVPVGTVSPEGVAYNARATGYKPDHLAVLPTGRGACGLADGCGVLVNVTGGASDRTPGGRSSTAGPDPKDVQPEGGDMRRTIWQRLGEFLGIINQTSHSDIRNRLEQILMTKFGVHSSSEDGPSVWVVDVFDRSVVYYHDGKTYRAGYTVDNRSDVITLSSDPPVEVRRTTAYKPVANSVPGEPTVLVPEPGAGADWEDGAPGYGDHLVLLGLNEHNTDAVPGGPGDEPPGYVVNPFASEHAARVEDPATFKKDTFRRKKITKGVTVILAKRPGSDSMVVQSYRFDAKVFTPAEAREWLKKHKVSAKLEPAEASANDGDPDNPPGGPSGPPASNGGPMPLTKEQKGQVVDRLVANCNCSAARPWKGKTREELNTLSDDTLVAYDVWNTADTTPKEGGLPAPGQPGMRQVWNTQAGRWELHPANDTPPPAPAAPPAPAVPVAVPVGNTGSSPAGQGQKTDEWLRSAPEQVRQVVANAINMQEHAKQEIIGRLVANLADGSEARTKALAIYGAMDLNDLQVLAAAVPRKEEPAVPQSILNYFGNQGAAPAAPVTEEALVAPVYDFTK